jgi:polysaccharide export outer membrane protein
LEVDLPSLFSATGRGKDVLVANGDTIFIDRQPIVYIYGEVQRPGPMRLERGMTVMQALATGGGLTLRGTQKGLRVHRKGAQGKIEVIEPTLDDKVQDGDVVFVRESLF